MAASTVTKITTTTIQNPIVDAKLNQHHHSIQLLHSSANNVGGVGVDGMPHGLGLLTTVASLPPKYRSRYLNISTKTEIPLDLSVKPMSPEIVSDVPIATSFTEVYTEPSSDLEQPSDELTHDNENYIRDNQMDQRRAIKNELEITETSNNSNIHNKSTPITPPPTPTKRKFSEHSNDIEPEAIVERIITDTYTNPIKMAKTKEQPSLKRESTPSKPIRGTDTAPKTIKAQPSTTRPSKASKATRKLKFDEETSSPVSGTIIRPLEDITDGTVQYSNGDIDPKYNIVEITEETKAELAAIKNVIGDYICRLCRLKFDDAFGLAQHRCACIVLLEYRCPECGKQFNCPANLASHRRWHKPKKDGNSSNNSNNNNNKNSSGGNGNTASKKENRNTTNVSNVANAAPQQKRGDATPFACAECGKKFKRQAYLRKHQLMHDIESKKAGKANDESADGLASATAIVAAKVQTTIVATTTTTTATTNIGGSYKTYSVGFSSTASLSSSTSASSPTLHSYSGVSLNHDDDIAASSYMINRGGSARNGLAGGGSISISGSRHGGDCGGSVGNLDYDYDVDSMSDCSNSSTGYGRLQIVESGLTEEENIAAAALTNLRNCASVIQHTTLAH